MPMKHLIFALLFVPLNVYSAVTCSGKTYPSASCPSGQTRQCSGSLFLGCKVNANDEIYKAMFQGVKYYINSSGTQQVSQISFNLNRNSGTGDVNVTSTIVSKKSDITCILNNPTVQNWKLYYLNPQLYIMWPNDNKNQYYLIQSDSTKSKLLFYLGGKSQTDGNYEFGGAMLNKSTASFSLNGAKAVNEIDKFTCDPVEVPTNLSCPGSEPLMGATYRNNQLEPIVLGCKLTNDDPLLNKTFTGPIENNYSGNAESMVSGIARFAIKPDIPKGSSFEAESRVRPFTNPARGNGICVWFPGDFTPGGKDSRKFTGTITKLSDRNYAAWNDCTYNINGSDITAQCGGYYIISSNIAVDTGRSLLFPEVPGGADEFLRAGGTEKNTVILANQAATMNNLSNITSPYYRCK